ncbi:MAG: DUF2974 domain-containing protein [Clostridia bacterium]|nr:DUF2974 domain-containing protein [Clostridia bacterium]
MADFIDYLDWRGDLGFDSAAFNDVDSLILSDLSYIPFGSIVSPSSQGVSLAQAGEAFLAEHPVDEKKERNNVPALLEKAIKTKRFSQLILSDSINIFDAENATQFSCIAFTLPNNRVYIAFRGTDGTLVGWKEDFNMSFMDVTPSQIYAARYIDEHFFASDKRLLLGGHSKGGNLAVYAAMNCSSVVKNRIEHVWSLDGPGFRHEVVTSPAYIETAEKCTLIVPERTVFGLILETDMPTKVIKSSEVSILQHDPFSWQVSGGSFVETEDIAWRSKFWDRAMSTWIDTFDPDQRKEFFDAFFDIISAPNADTVAGLYKSKLATINFARKAFKQLPEENQATLKSVFAYVAGTGKDFLGTALPRLLRDKNETDRPENIEIRPKTEKPPKSEKKEKPPKQEKKDKTEKPEKAKKQRKPVEDTEKPA